MKKLAMTLLASTALTSAFSAPQSSTSALYPMDSFNPQKFTASNIKEFVKKYSSEADAIVKKGEFETTAEFQTRLAEGFTPKLLNKNKIYAFQLDSIITTYNPDKTRYEIKLQRQPDLGRDLFGGSGWRPLIIGMTDSDKDKFTPRNTLRVGKLVRTSNQYTSSNAYGKKAKVTRIHGKDFYINSSKFFNVHDNALIFPTEIEHAKKNASCNKQVYIFAKLNGKTPSNYAEDFVAIKTPTIDLPLDIKVQRYTIPMDIVGMVLKCSNGTVLSVYDSSENNEQKFEPLNLQSIRDKYIE